MTDAVLSPVLVRPTAKRSMRRRGAVLALVALTVVAMASLLLPPSTAGATTGTVVRFHSALAFDDVTPCNHTVTSPCRDSGTFTADDPDTAAVLCPSGTAGELYWFTGERAGKGPFTRANRTLGCPDGSTLSMNVKRTQFSNEDDVAMTVHIGGTWQVTNGTGRFAGVQGGGTYDEIWYFGPGPSTLGGENTGTLH